MKFTVILVVCLVLVGCLHLAGPSESGSVSIPAADQTAATEGVRARHRVEPGQVASATGCTLEYRRYRPEAPVTEVRVVLAHGFLRTQDRMVDLARRLADAGVETVTLDFCNTRFWDGRHFRNGLDMVRVADALGETPVIYAGFSAGGLAAVVAGRNDPRTLGVVGLDLVDAGGLGEGAAAGLDRPLLGLVGDPSPCNAENNGLAVFAAAPRAIVERVAGAEHCDFESPTDWLCRLICRRSAPEPASPRRDIIDAATAAILSLSAGEPWVSSRATAAHPSSVLARAR